MAARLLAIAHGLTGMSDGYCHIESDNLLDPPRIPFEQNSTIMSVANECLALIATHETTTHASIRLELWSTEPPTTTPAHADRAEDLVRFTGSAVYGKAPEAPGPETHPLALGHAGTHRVRTFRWDGEPDHAAVPDLTRAVENFTVQL